MDLTQLRALRELADRGTITAVATATYCTPSAVSQQLKALEREVGVALTERDGRRLRLTGAGQALAVQATDVAAALARARAACDEYAAAPSGTVRLAAFESAAQMLLPGLIRRASAVPGLRLVCEDQDVAQSAFPTLTADFDIVVAHRPAHAEAWDTSRLEVAELMYEPLDVAFPRGHPLADRDHVTPDDLTGEDWVTVRQGFPIATVLEALAERTGETPHIVQRINDFHVVEALVAAGHGIALLPRFTADDRSGERFRLVPLTGIRAGRRIDALMRRDRAERFMVKKVLAALRDEAAAVSGGARSSAV